MDKPIVISELSGGLGNQMFQYAAGCGLALINKSKLFLNVRNFAKSNQGITPRKYELEVFNHHAAIAGTQELTKFFPATFAGKILNKITSTSFLYNEPHFNFDFKMMSLKGNVFLQGYWQSEKYFRHCESRIRNDFEFLAPKNNLTINIGNDINAQTSVSIHIRRGDYVTLPSANKHHGLTALSFYENAIKKMESEIGAPHFYIFSDDAEWVKGNFVKNRKDMTVVTHNHGRDSWQDMYLMSLCNHHIIANSSFSWWGAWLNANPQKIVIAPQRWFANEEMNNQTKDLIPQNWIRI